MLALHDAQGRTRTERYRAVAEECGESVATLRRWYARVSHLTHHSDWIPALAPAWCGGRPKAELSNDAWQFILSEWSVQSKPALLPIYRRAAVEASRHGWELPSYKTVKRRIDALPATVKVLRREGNEPFGKLFPAIQRDYSTLGLHDMWVSDGRKADVFCKWPDGYVGRPILMAWQELRTRKVLGWRLGKVENAELTRLSFRDAAQRSGALPHEALLDNGRAYASKQITGGQPTRNRFKFDEGEAHGLLTLLGIKPVWTTPYRGQSKPIESYWNTIAEAEKCAAFVGSYCGNKPDAKPEDFDPRKVVPIEHYAAFVRETIEEKNARPHRGDSMDGRSPDELYSELLGVTPVRHPTEQQLRLCLLVAEQVRLDEGYGLTILGNRYWCEALAHLQHRGPYTARFDPSDANTPVAVYDGERFLCEVPITLRVGFRDMEAAKDHMRERRRAQRAAKEEAAAIAGMERAKRSWEQPLAEAQEPGRQPTPPIPLLVRTSRVHRTDRPPLQTAADRERELQEFRAKRDRGLRLLREGDERKKAAGGL
nr:transposase domain-containing protein [Schlegelella koreensis]